MRGGKRHDASSSNQSQMLTLDQRTVQQKAAKLHTPSRKAQEVNYPRFGPHLIRLLHPLAFHGATAAAVVGTLPVCG